MRVKSLLVLALALSALIVASCNNQQAVTQPTLTKEGAVTSTATTLPTPTVQPTVIPVAQPSPVVPVMASIQEDNLTSNARVFYAVAKTLGLDLNVVKCSGGRIDDAYITYSIDGSLCFYVFFHKENFPLGKPEEQSGMYMIIAEKGLSPYNEGEWAVAILNSSYLSNDAKRKLSVFNKEVVDSWEETLLLNETIILPKELRDWWIMDIVPLSNEQVDLLYSSDLITIER